MSVVFLNYLNRLHNCYSAHKKAYPLLLKAGLSFDQPRRHNNRLRSYLRAHPDFGLDKSVVDTDVENKALVAINQTK